MEINKYLTGVQIDNRYLTETLEQSVALFKLSSKLIDFIKVYTDGEEVYDLDNGIVLLDRIEEITTIHVNAIESFHLNSVSGYQDLRRRLFDTFESYYRMKAIIMPTLESFIPLDMNELNEILSLLKRLSGHLGVFILRQYGLDDLNGELEFSVETFKGNSRMTDEDLVNLCNVIKEKIKEYRPRIETFDEYPELEEQFMEKVGPWFYDVDYIAYQDVIDVINEKLHPDDLKAKLNGGNDGDL